MLKKALKVTEKILLGILIFLVVFLLGVFVYDRIARANEHKLLEEKGYKNLVSVGEYSLNVCIYGSDAPKHTIVGMAGMGLDDFSCTGRYVTDGVADENRIVFIDRAGYGLSDDTSVPQTLERIIHDYRTALKNAGIEGPYLLMPHSIAGPYAAYWASEYPEEIEGVFFLDGTQLNGENFELIDEPTAWDTVSVAGSKIGLARIYYALNGAYLRKFPKENDIAVSQALFHCNGAYGKAKLSEEKLHIDNMRDSWNKTKANDVPKVYLCASYGMETVDDLKEMLEYQSKVFGTVNEMQEDALPAFLDEIIKFRHENVDVFCEHVGNCQIKLVPGNHTIYCHKPEKVCECLKEFLEELE